MPAKRSVSASSEYQLSNESASLNASVSGAAGSVSSLIEAYLASMTAISARVTGAFGFAVPSG